jgi:DNA-binding NarL/FixJ family response regulator
MVRVVLIDDDPRFAAGVLKELERIPGVVAVASFGCYEGAAAKFKEIKPDVVIMDLRLGFGVLDGVAATRQLKQDFPRVKVLAFSGASDQVLDAFSAGADGALDKSDSHEALARAILDVNKGVFAVGEQAGRLLRDFLHFRGSTMSGLSPTETEVLRSLEAGCTYKEAASRLGMSINTLKTHARRINEKSLAYSRREAVNFRKFGL